MLVSFVGSRHCIRVPRWGQGKNPAFPGAAEKGKKRWFKDARGITFDPDRGLFFRCHGAFTARQHYGNFLVVEVLSLWYLRCPDPSIVNISAMAKNS
jgi:hypothetical protein